MPLTAVLCKSNASEMRKFRSLFSRKVGAKVRVTIEGLLSEISLEQRTVFHRTFGTKQNFMVTTVISQIQLYSSVRQDL